MDNSRRALSAIDIRTRGVGLHCDAEVKGLYLRVLPSGGRSFVLRYTFSGRRRDMHLGSIRELTLSDARTRARSAWGQIDAGTDPIDARKLQVAQAKHDAGLRDWTFERAAREVHATLAPGWRNAKHGGQWINTLVTYVFEKIGARPVGNIDVADVLGVLKPIWTAKPETARRVRQRIDATMRWAVAHGYATTNPVEVASELLPKQRAAVQHHASVPVREAKAFYRRLAGSNAGSAALCLQFTALTAARSGEARGARWSEIDLKTRTWTVPAGRMKAGRPHQVPLPYPAIVVLRQARGRLQTSGDDLVFPSPRGGVLSDMAMSAVLRRLGVSATVHGLRSTFRDWCSENGVSREIAERALAHMVADDTEAAYNRTQLLDQRRRVMKAWGVFLRRLP